jgi:cellulose synthase/poly-beta-1,6-N-acetylglucosamine synthase-like glycosyltransferase
LLVVELTFAALLFILLLWTLYNLPILAKGVSRMREGSAPVKTSEPQQTNSPVFSIIVPAKNEEKVLGRLLESLLHLDYPKNRTQIIVVEDGSTDQTRQICEHYSNSNQTLIEFLHSDHPRTKPVALNHALSKARGDIIALFDADNQPEKDVLQLASQCFQDDSIAAVQGQTCPINLGESVLARLEEYNQMGWFRTYLNGKNSLGLFVPLTGSCGFIRRQVLLECGGWNEESLTEDVDLAVRLATKNHRIHYAAEIRSWQENASSIRQVIAQRRRWFRGYMETLLNYRRLLFQGSRIGADVEITLVGPLILGICFLTNTIGLSGLVFLNLNIGWPFTLISFATGILTLGTLIICAAGLFYQSQKKRWRNIVWFAPLIAYWFLNMAIAFYTTLCFLLRRPQSWEKTEKTGYADAPA